MAITGKVRLQYTTKAATFLKACIPPRNSHTNCYEALSDQYDPRDNEYAISMDSGQHNSLKLEEVIQSTSQSTSQFISQSTRQSTSQATFQTTSQSTSQSYCQSTC